MLPIATQKLHHDHCHTLTVNAVVFPLMIMLRQIVFLADVHNDLQLEGHSVERIYLRQRFLTAQ